MSNCATNRSTEARVALPYGLAPAAPPTSDPPPYALNFAFRPMRLRSPPSAICSPSCASPLPSLCPCMLGNSMLSESRPNCVLIFDLQVEVLLSLEDIQGGSKVWICESRENGEKCERCWNYSRQALHLEGISTISSYQ